MSQVHVIYCEGPPSIAPTLLGQHWVDTVSGCEWYSVGTDSINDWVLTPKNINDLLDVDAPTPNDCDVLKYNSTSGQWEAVSELSLDDKVSVSGNDSTPGYLGDKLIVAEESNTSEILELKEVNDGGDEDLKISIDPSKIEIDDLGDVDVATPNDGEVLTYNSTSGNWESTPTDGSTVKVSANDAASGFLIDKIITSEESNTTDILEIKEVNDGGDEDLKISIDTSKIELDNLGDVDVSTVVDGEVLTFNSTSGNWEPAETGNAITVEDEGIPLTTSVSKFNFVGPGVTVTEPTPDEVVITVSDLAACEDFTKVGHGLIVGDIVRHTGVSPEDFVKAQANTGVNSEALGIITQVSGNDFTVCYSGRISGLTGLTAGDVHFLSDTTAGGLTNVEPNISKPILFATSSSSAVLLIMRALDTSNPLNTVTVEDEGTPLTTAVTKFNFVGDGVTVTEPTPDEMLVTIAGGDGTVSVSANDTTPGYLLDKIITAEESNATDVLELKEVNDGGDEDLKISIDLSKIELDDLGDVDAPAPNDCDVLKFNTTSGNWETVADSEVGGKVKVSANDTTASYLLDKVIATEESNTTNAIEIKEVNDGGDEDLKIAFDETKLTITESQISDLTHYTHPNHTGEVTSIGDGAQALDKTAITNKTTVVGDDADYVLISDTSDSGNLKKVLLSELLDDNGAGYDDTFNFGEPGAAYNRFLEHASSQHISFNSSSLAMFDGEVVKVAISQEKNPGNNFYLQIIKNATKDGGAAPYQGGTQIGADIEKTAGAGRAGLDQLKEGLTGYNFSKGDRISAYIKKGETGEGQAIGPVVTLYIKYTV